jgi:hypothetical protein
MIRPPGAPGRSSASNPIHPQMSQSFRLAGMLVAKDR